MKRKLPNALWIGCVALAASAVFDAQSLLATASSQNKLQQSTQPPSATGQKFITSRIIGTLNYTGPHSWKGAIEVTSDNMAFQDGTITAQATGIPQGVTFFGDRKNVTLKNLSFHGVGDGINIGNNQAVDDVVIENCKFIDCRSPDTAVSHDTLLGHRGTGIFISRGKNWTIRNSIFKAKAQDPSQPDDRANSSQYACRLGSVHGLNVVSTRFENWCGKATTWLMFVRAAVFDQVQFEGGPVRIGVRPNDMPGIERGDCRNIIFRNCKFTFGVFEDWPAGILVFPGSEYITFENCEITTSPDSNWWLEVDSRETSHIRWKNCTWNGKKVEGYLGIRSSMSIEEMKAQNVGPIEPEPIREITSASEAN